MKKDGGKTSLGLSCGKLIMVAAIVLFLLPLIGVPPRIYLTLTIAGLAMGMLLFLVASGFNLIFGLMDVMNFAHGALFAWGAYVGFSSLKLLITLVNTDSLLHNFAAFFMAIVITFTAVSLLGIILEKVFVRRVYGDHLYQILITFGSAIVLEELIRIFWGVSDKTMPVPIQFQGNWDVLDVVVLRYPLIAILLGLIVFGSMQFVLKRTKVGTIIRAGVENREMIQAMGHNIFLYFTGVFAAGAGLAGLGGLAMAVFNMQIYPSIGEQYLIFAFIVVIIGGLGSVLGSLIGALIVGLSYNYMAYLFPPTAVATNVLIMVIILLIRPQGLFPEKK